MAAASSSSLQLQMVGSLKRLAARHSPLFHPVSSLLIDETAATAAAAARANLSALASSNRRGVETVAVPTAKNGYDGAADYFSSPLFFSSPPPPPLCSISPSNTDNKTVTVAAAAAAAAVGLRCFSSGSSLSSPSSFSSSSSKRQSFCPSSSSSPLRFPSPSAMQRMTMMSRIGGGGFGPRGVYFVFGGERRFIATQPPFLHLPALPPREFEADGSPKKYRLNQVVHDHKYDWERWTLRPAGVFHTVYFGEFAREVGPLKAALLQFHLGIAFVPTFLGLTLLAFALSSVGTIGIRPRRFTIEWMEASKERDRAENSNPMSRYLDRRRQERGPNWMCENWLPTHPYFMTMSRYHHDTELLRLKKE